MPQRDIVIPNIKVKEKAIFNLDELYKLLHRWFELYRYDLQEQEYRDDDTGNGKHVEIKWYSDKKIDDYFKYVIEVNFLLLGLEDIEIVKEGVKVKTNKCEVELRFKSYLLKDYNRMWERFPVLRVLREFYDRRIIASRIDGYEDEVYEETYKLINEVKAFLNLHRF